MVFGSMRTSDTIGRGQSTVETGRASGSVWDRLRARRYQTG